MIRSKHEMKLTSTNFDFTYHGAKLQDGKVIIMLLADNIPFIRSSLSIDDLPNEGNKEHQYENYKGVVNVFQKDLADASLHLNSEQKIMLCQFDFSQLKQKDKLAFKNITGSYVRNREGRLFLDIDFREEVWLTSVSMLYLFYMNEVKVLKKEIQNLKQFIHTHTNNISKIEEIKIARDIISKDEIRLNEYESQLDEMDLYKEFYDGMEKGEEGRLEQERDVYYEDLQSNLNDEEINKMDNESKGI
jgi:hypothetical protein